MKIIVITFIIIAVVILGGLWYLDWLRKCYDKHQAGDSAPKLVLERIAKSHQNCKIYDERRAAVKRYMLLITFCTLILGGGACVVDAKYEQWRADFKQWKVERAERKAQAELQKQKEERLEAERKAEEAAKARKRQEAEKLRAEQFQKLIGDVFPSAEEVQAQMRAEHLKAEQAQRQQRTETAEAGTLQTTNSHNLSDVKNDLAQALVQLKAEQKKAEFISNPQVVQEDKGLNANFASFLKIIAIVFIVYVPLAYIIFNFVNFVDI